MVIFPSELPKKLSELLLEKQFLSKAKDPLKFILTLYPRHLRNQRDLRETNATKPVYFIYYWFPPTFRRNFAG